MTIELIEIALAERQAHPRLPNRITGKVRAVLAETLGDQQHQYEIIVPAFIDRDETMTEEDVDLALLVKAAEIINRIKARLAASGPKDSAA